MTLNQLRTFALVARLGSVRDAAQELGVSEPAVSGALAALRSDLGDALVIRSGSGIALTAGGRTLAAYAQEIVGLVEQSRREVALASTAGDQLRVLATPAFAEHAAGRLLAAFARRHAGPAPRVVVDSGSDSGALLAERAYDITLGARPPGGSGLHALPFLRYHRIIVAAPNHPLTALRQGVQAQAALSQRWFTGPLSEPAGEQQRWIARLPVMPELVQLDSEAAGLAAVRAGEGIMLAVAHVLRRELENAELVQIPFPGTPLTGLWWATALSGPRAAPGALRLQSFAGSAEATEAMMAAAGPRGLVRRGTRVHVALWSNPAVQPGGTRRGEQSRSG